MTTRRSARTMSMPVAGFRPFRWFFCFTQNLPKLEISTSSPDSRVRLMSSRTASTVSLAFLRLKPLAAATASMISALVRVPVLGIFRELSHHIVVIVHLSVSKGYFEYSVL